MSQARRAGCCRCPTGTIGCKLMGHYRRETLRPRAVVLTFAHGGPLSVYSGAPIVRLDLLEPHSLDTVIADLQRRGHRPVFVLDLAVESEVFHDSLQGLEVPHARLAGARCR